MKLLEKSEVVKQSKRAKERWGELWHGNAQENSTMYQDIQGIHRKGLGKSVIVASFGPSLLENIRKIKKHNLHYDYDIICVDKAVKTFIAEGVIPNYVVISDAQVSFELYGDIDPKYCKRIKLISSITANSKWVKHWSDNQGSVYFYINKDNIRTHKEFGVYLKGKNFITVPAASNVGNCAYVMASMVLNYKKIVLAGYDYSFKIFDSYYGDGDKKPLDTNMKQNKHALYNHHTLIDINGDLVQASSNMIFSSKWLIDFVKNMSMAKGIETINATGAGILLIQNQANIK